MKQAKKSLKKLKLNKQTIAILKSNEMKKIHGGWSSIFLDCDVDGWETERDTACGIQSIEKCIVDFETASG